MELKIIAHYKGELPEKFGVPRQSGLAPNLEGEIHFTNDFRNADALRGITSFDYLWLIWGFSANAEKTHDGAWRPLVRPPRLGGNKTAGVFATRSPFRPNPLGLSCVKLQSVDFDAPDGPVLHVLGADLMDGTPIYDIKPYISYTDSHPEARSGFVDENEWPALKVIIPEEIASELSPKDKEKITEILSLDPRPQYKKNPANTYGLAFGSRDIHFKVEGDTLTVIDIS